MADHYRHLEAEHDPIDRRVEPSIEDVLGDLTTALEGLVEQLRTGETVQQRHERLEREQITDALEPGRVAVRRADSSEYGELLVHPSGRIAGHRIIQITYEPAGGTGPILGFTVDAERLAEAIEHVAGVRQ